MANLPDIYVKIGWSGKPTEMDDVGCDGMYIESIEKTNEFDSLLKLSQDILSDGMTVTRRKTLRGIVAALTE